MGLGHTVGVAVKRGLVRSVGRLGQFLWSTKLGDALAEAAEIVGRPGEPVYALAFPGGAFDTAFHLGVLHAFLVSGRRPPDIVSGISAGAIVAAAFAEVFEEQGGAKRVARFRQFLGAYREAPVRLFRSTLPDPYEVDANRALRSLRLPIHFAGERVLRREAARSTSGLIRLLNDLLSIRLRVDQLTLLAHAILMFRGASAYGFLRRTAARVWGGVTLWLLLLWLTWRVTPILRQLIHWTRDTWDDGHTAGNVIARWRRAGRTILRSTINAVACGLAYVLLAVAPALAMVYVAGTLLNAVLSILPFIRSGRWHRWVARAAAAIGTWAAKRTLRQYDLAHEVGQSYDLRQMLVEMFDRHYYGELGETEFRQALERAHALSLDQGIPPDSARSHPRSFRHYRRQHHGRPGVRAVVFAANLRTNRIEPIPLDTPVVDGILAAMAGPPFWKPVCMGRDAYIDAAWVSNEPTAELIAYLRGRDRVAAGTAPNEVSRLMPGVTGLLIHPVSPVRVDDDEAGPAAEAPRAAFGLVSILKRVRALQSAQTFSLEWRLTNLYSSLIPPGRSVLRTTDAAGRARQFLAAEIFPISSSEAVRVNESILQTNDAAERDLVVRRAVAAGCRSTLTAFVGAHLQPAQGQRLVMDCAQAMRDVLRVPNLPASAPATGPGVAEVCSACVLATGEVRSLELRRGSKPLHPWPPEGSNPLPNPAPPAIAVPPLAPAPPAVAAPPVLPGAQPENAPAPHPGGSPWVTLVFSGGVFRGVFQVGVLNAISVTGITPAVYAGSSVGSIMAATAAVLLRKPAAEQQRQMQEIAATFLALDRLVLTDRFSDLVRRFTVRAASTPVSIRDVDELLRRYDAPTFSDTARRALAGFERLFFVSPFELIELTRAIRTRDYAGALQLTGAYVQEFFDRRATSDEILGAEPLALLIDQLVVRPSLGRAARLPGLVTLEDIGVNAGGLSPSLLLTTTNLTQERLAVIGHDADLPGPGQTSLLNALLASSAFPGVFRPRRSFELFPAASADDQFLDGGILDNLPLDAVIQFLDARIPQPARGHPDGPHLIVVGSLEPRLRPVPNLDRLVRWWPETSRRARQLSYNRKIDSFAEAQADFRLIRESLRGQPGVAPDGLVDLAVAAVKPEWLCGTFAFHPMLGFSQPKQAGSIAHGCALTLAELDRQRQEVWRNAASPPWAGSLAVLPGAFLPDADDASRRIPAPQRPRPAGGCWFSDRICPFSPTGLAAAGRFTKKEHPETWRAVARIHELCGRRETHQPEPDFD